MDVNYKVADTRKIIDYLESCPGNIPVENIIRFSGADKLRVYPLSSNWNRAALLKSWNGKSWERLWQSAGERKLRLRR